MLRKRNSAILRRLTFFLCATLSQIVQVLGLTISGGCGLFLLGNYSAQVQDPPVTELATAFVSLGVLATIVQVGVIIAFVITGDKFYRTVEQALLSITILLYIISIFAQSRRHNRRTMLFLQAHFISAESWVSMGEVEDDMIITGMV